MERATDVYESSAESHALIERAMTFYYVVTLKLSVTSWDFYFLICNSMLIYCNLVINKHLRHKKLLYKLVNIMNAIHITNNSI